MTARECERCGEALRPGEEVVFVLYATLEDFEKGRHWKYGVIACYHEACYEEVAPLDVDPEDEDALRETCSFCGHPIEVECGECVKRRFREARERTDGPW